MYVAPKEIGIGSRWETIKIKHDGKLISVPQVIQSKYQYVSIIETLKSLFSCEEFRNMYFEYNLKEKHSCVEGEYKNFCCGSAYKNNRFFQENPHAIQIQISSDEAELCKPLQSKVGRHKAIFVYFTIRNVPTQFLSKLDNIYLICICNADDVKTRETDLNNIWQPITEEIQYLESVGIRIDDNTKLKGTITQLVFDNLGANISLGYSASFSASYYCRICECSKQICQVLSKEDMSKIRTRESYQNNIAIVDNSIDVSLDETKGIKYFCNLSNLLYFNIIENPTADIMHDLNEGLIPFLLKHFFTFCFSQHLFTLNELNWMVQFHDYGRLSQKNIPSNIGLDKRSLGQNAAQSKCLFQNLPYILYKYRDQPAIKCVWKCVTSLLRITEIAYSEEYTENDLQELEQNIFVHLESIRDCFNVSLIPKHHFVLHYPRIMRIMGPLKHMNMFRYESKHKVFKKKAETSSFRNVNKTLAKNHQQKLCRSEFTYRDDMSHSKLKCNTNFMSTYKHLLTENFENHLESVYEVDSLLCNNFQYVRGLLIINNNNFYEIHAIIIAQNQNYFICKKIIVVALNNF